MLDHAPRRQVGQFVIIGRPEQMVLERLLLADVGGTRQQQIAVGDPDRAVGGEKDLPGLAAGDAFLGDRVAAAAQQFDTGFAAMVQLRRRRRMPAAAIFSCAAAASLTSRKRPCSSCTVTPVGSIFSTSRRIASSASRASSPSSDGADSCGSYGLRLCMAPTLTKWFIVLVKLNSKTPRQPDECVIERARR